MNEDIKVEHFDMISSVNLNGEAACRRSTSGGLVVLGTHMIKSWTSTQKITALSSGEAEYYAVVKGTSQELGVRSILEDFKIENP